MTILPDLKNIINDVLNEVRPSNTQDTDLVCIYIKHSELKVPITITPRQLKWSQMDSTAILDTFDFQYVLSSRDTLKANESLEIHVGYHFCSGRIWRSSPHPKIRIINTDNLCFCRAVIVAKARADNDPRFTPGVHTYSPPPLAVVATVTT